MAFYIYKVIHTVHTVHTVSTKKKQRIDPWFATIDTFVPWCLIIEAKVMNAFGLNSRAAINQFN